jgi:hypothetical protein
VRVCAQLGLHICIFFLHFRSKISLSDVMALSAVVLPLGFAIGIRCLVLVLSRTQHPTRLNNFVVVTDTSVPTGIQLQMGVDMDTYAVFFPVFARTYTCVRATGLLCFERMRCGVPPSASISSYIQPADRCAARACDVRVCVCPAHANSSDAFCLLLLILLRLLSRLRSGTETWPWSSSRACGSWRTLFCAR